MKIIGLVGGIASGKSAVAAALARRGAAIFDADKIGHEVINLREVRDELVARWGAGVLGADGRIDRGAVAEQVFGDAPEALAERRFLEEALHGRIRQQIEAQARQLPDDGVPAVVIDAPLLVEAGWNDICDAVLCVDVPREMRLARAMANRGWTAEEFTRREAAQLPIEEKRPWCTHAVDNSGSLAELDAQLARFWAEVVDG